MTKKRAVVEEKACVACGCCHKVCPKAAIAVVFGVFAAVDDELCVGCGQCVKECPASLIRLEVRRS